GREQQLVFALRAHHRLSDHDIRAVQRLVCAEAEVDLVRERDLERIAFYRTAMRARVGLDRRQRARVASRRGPCERAGSQCGIACAFRGETAVAGETPGPAD